MSEQHEELKPPQILNEADAAQYVGMSQIWLRRMRQRGIGPEYFRMGKKSVRYTVPDLDRFLETQRVRHYERRIWKT